MQLRAVQPQTTHLSPTQQPEEVVRILQSIVAMEKIIPLLPKVTSSNKRVHADTALQPHGLNQAMRGQHIASELPISLLLKSNASGIASQRNSKGGSKCD